MHRSSKHCKEVRAFEHVYICSWIEHLGNSTAFGMRSRYERRAVERKLSYQDGWTQPKMVLLAQGSYIDKVSLDIKELDILHGKLQFYTVNVNYLS